jgi:hypothetical protein
MVKRLQEVDILNPENKKKKVVKKVKEEPVKEVVKKEKKPPTEKQLAAIERMRAARELKKQEKLKAEAEAILTQKKLERKLKREEKLAKRDSAEKQMIIDSVKEEHREESIKSSQDEEENIQVLQPDIAPSTPVKSEAPPEIKPIKLAHRIWKAPKYEKDFERGYKKMGQSLFGRPFHAGKRLH